MPTRDFHPSNSRQFLQKFSTISIDGQKIWTKTDKFDKMELIYLLLMEFWRWMILVTGDFMKMLFRSFWLTMARVKNVRLKSASIVSSFSFSRTHIRNYSCVSFFLLRLCRCIRVCVCVCSCACVHV